MSRKNKIAFAVFLMLALAAPYVLDSFVLAEPNIPAPPLKNLKFRDVLGWLNTFVTWMFTVFMIIAVVYALLAAFNYLFSEGDEEKVKEVRRMLIYIAVAVALALLSVAIRYIVADFLGVPAPQ